MCIDLISLLMAGHLLSNCYAQYLINNYVGNWTKANLPDAKESIDLEILVLAKFVKSTVNSLSYCLVDKPN